MNLNNNIKQTFRIAGIELSTMFYSPVAWIVLIIFASIIGYDYADQFDRLLHSQELGRGMWSASSSIYNSWITGILTPILRNLYLYIPLITMGLMSREYQSGSIKLLYSSPINNSSIIMGKFMAMMVYGAALTSIIGINVLFSAMTIVNFQWQMLLVALLGIYLLILAYSSIGLFMSSLTQYQVVAAIGTLGVLAVFNFIGDVGQGIDFVREITFWLSMYGRSSDFIKGLLPSADVIYFLIVISLFLSLSIFKLNTEKSIMGWKKKTLKYCGIVTAALIIGYISSRPYMKLYYDGTYPKVNTLALESQDIIAELKQPMTITTYVNILAPDYTTALPFNLNYDAKRYEKFLRFKPDIKMKYVYYYHPAYNPDLDARFPDMTPEQRKDELCKISQLDKNLFKPIDQIKQQVDLEKEGYQFVRVAELADGKAQVLRMFNDNERHPREAQISVALKRLASEPMEVAFVEGYGSRDVLNYGPLGYYTFAYDKWFRSSLLNNGFNTKTIDLDKQNIDQSISVLVLSDIREPLSDIAISKIKSYIESGGNMFILGEYNRSKNMNKVGELLGISFSDGVLACESELTSPVALLTSYTEYAKKINSIIGGTARMGYGVSVPTCVAIDYSEAQKCFEVNNILETSDQAWIEYETKDLVDGEFIYNPQVGEKKDRYATLIAMKRKVGDKEQRIVVSGDSDFIANEELSLQRPGMDVNNLSTILGVFRWFSNDKYPITTDHPSYIDTSIRLSGSWRIWVTILFVVIIPGALIGCCVTLILRRQRK